MKVNVRHIWIGLMCLVGINTSCTNDDASIPLTGEEAGAGHVVLSYAVAGNTLSRATEAGWNVDWNENDINRLDLFIFREGSFITHYGEQFSTTVEAPQDENEETNYKTWEIPATELSPNLIHEGDQVYLIANCSSVSTSGRLADLQAASIGELSCHTKQEQFIMTGTAVVGAKSGNDVEITVDLIRVAAKIRLSFTGDTKWTDVSYRFVNYASTSALLEESDEQFAPQLSVYPSVESLEEVTENTATYYETDDQLVLYSYVNNWYDERVEDPLYGEIPIDETKQTYVLLRAPYPANSSNYYYYKVPVNFQLPEDNDAVTPDESYKDLYRLQRNYIYDITVTIDREGGPEREPVKPKLYYQVMSFDEENIDIPAFK